MYGYIDKESHTLYIRVILFSDFTYINKKSQENKEVWSWPLKNGQ